MSRRQPTTRGRHGISRAAGSRLLALYPRRWRARYGDELAELLEQLAAGDGTRARRTRRAWRTRLDLVRGAGREWVSPTTGNRDPDARARSGGVLVLWAWAGFVIAGAIVAKTSEHWQTAAPAAVHGAADAAFVALTALAAATAVLVLAGIAPALPATVRFLRGGGWPRIRTRCLVAGGLTIIAVAATAGLVAWAHRLTPAARNGDDGLYAAAFVAWASTCAAVLLAWTAVAERLARELRYGRTLLRIQALIAAVVAVSLAAMTTATVAWWVTVAQASPAALTGGSTLSSPEAAAHASALVPQLVAAAVLMVSSTALAALGAIRADAAFAGA